MALYVLLYMIKTYSYGLHGHSIKGIELNEIKPSEANKYFRVSPHPLSLWQQLTTKTDNLRRGPSQSKDMSHAIVKWGKVRAVAQKYWYRTQAYMAE